MVELPYDRISGHHRQVLSVIEPLVRSNQQGIQVVPRRDYLTDTVEFWVSDQFANVGEQRGFRTVIDGVIATYYETWHRKNEKTLNLAKVYLHFVGSADPSSVPKELVLLHTEPIEAPSPDERVIRLSRWKTGPHIHVKTSAHGLAKCHFMMDACEDRTCLRSLSTFYKALKSLTVMLADELAEHLELAAG